MQEKPTSNLAVLYQMESFIFSNLMCIWFIQIENYKHLKTNLKLKKAIWNKWVSFHP